MSEPTKPFIPPIHEARSSGIICSPQDTWRFTYDTDQAPLVSSGTKSVYMGTFSAGPYVKSFAARALAFNPSAVDAFGSECANLSMLSGLGVGPRLLAITHHDFDRTGVIRPTIIEEDAGVSLANLLQSATDESKGILYAKKTPERTLQNQKILYDIFVQLLNAHRAGLYHCDLRCENVCVRRFGKAPADIKATLVDFELGQALTGGIPNARASLFRTIFTEVPSLLAGKHLTHEPIPLELDMGYLSAFQYHLKQGCLVLNGTNHTKHELEGFAEYLANNVSYFGYSETDHLPYARALNKTADIDQLAEGLGLVPANEHTFTSQLQLNTALRLHRPYLDAEDMSICIGTPEADLDKYIDRLVVAKFETYKALRREQGREVRYERIMDQPADLRNSNYAQAEHIPTKVHALGYLLLPKDKTEGLEKVTEFNDEQIEILARLEHDRWVNERLAAGWTLNRDSAESDPKRKTSPYLVPYDELEDEIKKYDRDAARQLIPLVEIAELVVVRP